MTELQREVDWNGDEYHRLSDMQFQHGMELLQTIQLKGNELLLDAGCGSGRITKEILKQLPTGGIIGVDLSERMLETARREVRGTPEQRVEFIYANLDNFRPPLQVDGIYSNMALHFIADHKTLFANFAQMLKPDGFLALQFGKRPTANPTAIRLMEVMNSEPYNKYIDAKVFNFRGGDEATDRNALEAAGFVDIDVKSVELHPSDEQLDKMREFMRNTTFKDVGARLPADLREKFAAEADNTINQMFGQEHPFEFLQVHARAPKLH